jgi:hypothetical protein
LTVLAVFLAALTLGTLGVNLGLFEAIVDVAKKAAVCNTCCTFWLAVAAGFLTGLPVIDTLVTAILAAYASNWVAVLLVWLNKKYDELWEKMR